MQPSLLLIEDDPISRDVIRALCERRGFTVDAVSDGFQGLTRLRGSDYVVALVDYHLPEMDGYALARLMRDLNPGLPLVGITADRHGLAARRGADALFDAVVPKPITENTLHAALDTLLAKGAASAGLGRETGRGSDPEPGLERARRTARALWHRFGLADLPTILVCPEPTSAQGTALRHAFTLTGDHARAEAILLVAASGLDAARALQAKAPHALPLLALAGTPEADATFRIDDLATWERVAERLRAPVGDRGSLSHQAGFEPAVKEAAAPVGASSLASALREATRPPGGAEADAEGPIDGIDGGFAPPRPARPPSHTGPRAPGRPPSLAERARQILGKPASESAEPPPAAVVPEPEGGGPVLDAAVYGEIIAILGRDRVLGLMGLLATQCARSFEGHGETPAHEGLAEEAHRIVSSAGLLGFTSLSNACRELEAALCNGEPVRARFAAVRAAYQRTTAAIEALRAAA